MHAGIMLLYGLLPFWGQFRQSEVYRRSLPGFNAAAVGLVVMAVFAMYNSFTCAPSSYVHPESRGTESASAVPLLSIRVTRRAPLDAGFVS
jgi:hypothetical protein